MSDESPPNQDFFEQLNAAADESMPKLLQRLRDAVESNGRQRVNVKCDKCGHSTSTSVEVADVEETRKIVELFGSLKLRAKQAAQKDGGEESKQARAILQEISEMTSEELAEELARIEKELGADGAPS